MDIVKQAVSSSLANIDQHVLVSGFYQHDDGNHAWADAHANFLSSLSGQESQDLLDCSRLLNLKSRDQLFRAGDRSNDVYIVASGCIRLFQVSSTGKETILWFSKTDDHIFNLDKSINI